MKVIVVDAEKTERRTFAHGLGTYGFEVRDAESPEQADGVMLEHGADIAVFSIADDPFESYRLADMLRTHNPEIFLIVAIGSGVSARDLMTQYAADGWLERPYRLESAVQTLGAVAGFQDYDNPESGLYQVPRSEPRRITG
jgi:DNA-binding response OmpR family regulator